MVNVEVTSLVLYKRKWERKRCEANNTRINKDKAMNEISGRNITTQNDKRDNE